jgi:hypothetical protein
LLDFYQWYRPYKTEVAVGNGRNGTCDGGNTRTIEPGSIGSTCSNFGRDTTTGNRCKIRIQCQTMNITPAFTFSNKLNPALKKDGIDSCIFISKAG